MIKKLEFNGYRYTRNTDASYVNNRKFYKRTDSTSYLHRDIYEYYKGTIPKKHYIIHIDNNYDNNDISNLELVSARELYYRKKASKNKVNSLKL